MRIIDKEGKMIHQSDSSRLVEVVVFRCCSWFGLARSRYLCLLTKLVS